jgi:hypothetical protein
MVTTEQVFLPYALMKDNKTTLYQKMLKNNFLLEEGK